MNRTLAVYRQQNPSLPTNAVQIGMLTSVDAAAHELFSTRATILSLVSIAEEFSLSRLFDVTDVSAKGDRIAQLLWDSELARAGETWEARQKLWRRYFELEAGEFSDHEALLGFIVARNTIAHGLGELTRRQLRDVGGIKVRLGKAGIALAQNSLVLDASHVEACAVVVKSYIRWVDLGAHQALNH